MIGANTLLWQILRWKNMIFTFKYIITTEQSLDLIVFLVLNYIFTQNYPNKRFFQIQLCLPVSIWSLWELVSENLTNVTLNLLCKTLFFSLTSNYLPKLDIHWISGGEKLIFFSMDLFFIPYLRATHYMLLCWNHWILSVVVIMVPILLIPFVIIRLPVLVIWLDLMCKPKY